MPLRRGSFRRREGGQEETTCAVDLYSRSPSEAGRMRGVTIVRPSPRTGLLS